MVIAQIDRAAEPRWLLNLLNWRFQPSNRGDGRSASIGNARSHVHKLQTEMTSLREYLRRQIERARKSATGQTGVPLDRFPERFLHGAEQRLDPEILSGGEQNEDA